MARNQEKQLGRLNRLWLEKERQDGHLKDLHVTRPRLSTLNSATEVKKWIPSIKKEIEYYLEQSQLSHYSERKIQEFEEHIEELRKDYQSHLWKLRRLDPSCKEHPWKLRGYTRKRQADAQLQTGNATDSTSAKLLRTPVLLNEVRQDLDLDDAHNRKQAGVSHRLPEASSSSTFHDCTNLDSDAQDKPLNFSKKMDPKCVWENSSFSTLGEDVLKMKDILFSHHQVLAGNTPVLPYGSREAPSKESGEAVTHLLGLDCYSASSSEDDDDT
ncbi:uncharacterized protein [Ambystoma mexicanum]|uniref:uncharacterized protein n=1 Tax=Ambystoma mexicanum TaxID=8296 RepID=UPI0037E93B52